MQSDYCCGDYGRRGRFGSSNWRAAAYSCIGFEPGVRCVENLSICELQLIDACMHAAGRVDACLSVAIGKTTLVVW